MLLSSSNMEHAADSSPLSTIQQCVVNALAAGSTLTDAAEAYSVHRVTVYRWMKTCQPFSAALQRARAEFVLARRDDPPAPWKPSLPSSTVPSRRPPSC
jgi:hypothetical protein